MKLCDIVIPPPLLVEGFNRKSDRSIGFNNDSLDDSFIRGTMDPLASRKTNSGQSRIQKPKDADVRPHTWRERHEMEDVGLGDLPEKVPVYYGYNLTQEPTPEGKEKYDMILNALKGREGHSFDPDALEELMNRSVRGVHNQLAQYGNIRGVKKVIVIPTPSSSSLPKMFADKLAASFKEKIPDTEVHDILEPNLKHSVGIASGTKVPAKRLKSLYLETIVNDFLRGTRDEYEMMEYIDEAEQYLRNRISQTSGTEAEILQFDLEGLLDAKKKFYYYVDTPKGQVALAKKRKDYEEKNASGQRRVHDMFSGLRNLIYNRMKIKSNATIPKVSENTLVIIADDNIEKGGTIGDVYRTLAKSKIIGLPGVKVIGAVMHRLGKAKGDFAK